MSTGNIVTGDDYFPRPADEKKLWRHLSDGAHILLLAPRRVGKSSMITHIKNNPNSGYAVIYVFVQACDSEQSFYQKMLREIYRSEHIKKSEKIKNKLSEWARSINFSLSVSPTNLEFELGEDKGVPKLITYEMIRDVLYESLKLSEDTIIIAIDEFPDVLERISEEQGKKGVEQFLSGIRALCQDPEFNEKVQFILTGSIGLDTLAEKLAVTDLINMLVNMSVRPFKDAQAMEFINFYLKKHCPDIILNIEAQQAIIDGVGWNMPYYLGLVCSQLIDIFDEEERQIEYSDIKVAIDNLFSPDMKTVFSHWRDRLNRLESSERSYAKQVLDLVSRDNTDVTYGEIFNLSQHSDFKDTINSRYVINCLLHDGYLYQPDDDIYQFTSPLLKRWWGRYGS
ncbi:hypothetical protein KPY62_08350 [Psychrobacter sp. TAE2020]|uniref:hypothetical protein n=1 Tax=Psychrobacter sp. TAE2020 TaxID=2846762 RepID=UPI001C12108E|nr:hypothetical protein [Psychrobacter sp. TAE2020]MBU5617099.1 hypothetical protein [Psychrobacter sp. TAE2020]